MAISPSVFVEQISVVWHRHRHTHAFSSREGTTGKAGGTVAGVIA